MKQGSYHSSLAGYIIIYANNESAKEKNHS